MNSQGITLTISPHRLYAIICDVSMYTSGFNVRIASAQYGNNTYYGTTLIQADGTMASTPSNAYATTLGAYKEYTYSTGKYLIIVCSNTGNPAYADTITITPT